MIGGSEYEVSTDGKTDVFNGDRVLEMLNTFKYQEAYNELWKRLAMSDPVCFDFVRQHNFHVPLLYLHVRNTLRFVRKGSTVLGRKELLEILTNVIYLIVRVAQDADACKTRLAKSNTDLTLHLFFDKTIAWLKDLKAITFNGQHTGRH